jgi:anti-sigma regulatory factor (Ser/Thr protein kinase)
MNADPTVDLASAVLGEHLQMQIPSRIEWLAPCVDHLTRRAVLCGVCDEARAVKLALVLHEALTNSVVHGNLGVASSLKEQDDDAFARALADRGADPAYSNRTVTIDVDYDGSRCQWALTDEGDGFDLATVLTGRPPTPEELLRPSGRGILLMCAFMDEVTYEAGGRRVVLTMRRAYQRDQRRHPRVPLSRRVRVGPLRGDGSVDWDALQDGITQDLSEGGISILQKELARADRVVIGVDVDGQVHYLPAEVRHCRAAESGMVELGCRFITPTAPQPAQSGDELASVQEAVGALLQRNTGALPVAERRRHRRAPYTERIELAGPTATDPTTAIGRNLSRGGVAFITTAPVTREVKLLTLPVKNGQPLRLWGRVVRCAAIAEAFYEVGVCFTALA